MGSLVRKGKVKFLEDVIDGLGNAQNGFIRLLKGKNFGKLVVKVGRDDVQ